MIDIGPDGSLRFADPAAERITIEHTGGGVRMERGSQRWFFPATRLLTYSEQRTLDKLEASWREQQGLT